jgi:hypothetical protein
MSMRRTTDKNEFLTRIPSEPHSPRKYEGLICVIFGICTAAIATVVSKYLFLCFLYGFSRVHSGQLHFTNMSHGQAWIVSNGDRIGPDLHPLFSFIVAIIWIIPTFVGLVLIRGLLPKRDKMPAVHPADTLREHRPIKISNQRLRILRWKMFGIFLGIVVIVGIMTHWLGPLALVLLLPGFLAILGVEGRFRFRYFIWTILTTPCPKCSAWPMRYREDTGRRDHRGLLICEKCKIEWDLGRAVGVSENCNLSSLFDGALETVEKHIQNNDRPEIRQAVERLKGQGHSLEEARRLVSMAVIVEYFHQYFDRKPTDLKRFAWNLAQLPQKPWDAQGRELYQSGN